MSWWTNIRDTTELLTAGPFASESATNKAGGLANSVLGRSSAQDKRLQAQDAQSQIQAYKDQTAITQRQIDAAQAEKSVVRRQVEQKQIRALRNNYRPSGGTGFLGNAGQNNSSLGGTTPIPSKLGTV